MKTIFIPKIPHNAIRITTNSSSEIFVIGKHKTPDLVDEIIDQCGWREWFGPRKQIQSLEEARSFLKENGHVADRLFGFYGWPSEYAYDEISILGSTFLQSSDRQTELAKALAPYRINYSEESKLRARFKDNPLKLKELDKKREDSYIKQDEIREKFTEDWLDKQNLQSLVGQYYYECGEDNELEDWELVYTSIPGKHARLS